MIRDGIDSVMLARVVIGGFVLIALAEATGYLSAEYRLPLALAVLLGGILISRRQESQHD